MPKAAVMHDTSACVNHGYPSAPNPKPLKNNIHLNTTPPLRSQDPKKQLRGSTIEGFKHITNTLQNTPSYIHWKKKHYILHPFKTPHYTLHPTICVILLGLVVSWNPSQPQPTTFCQQFFTPTKRSWCLELALQQQLSFCQGFLQRHLFWQEVGACAQHLLARCMHTGLATKFDSNAASAQLPPLLSSGPFPASP